MSGKLVTLVFTFNEAENIGQLVTEYFNALPDEILLVVDDDSPDGTGDRVIAMQDRFSNLHLLVRKQRRGRGTAAIEGYRYALDHWDFPYLAYMDGDLSHPPETIVRMLSYLDKYHVVLASRFSGNGRDLRSGLLRKLLSFASSGWVRVLFSTDIKDPTSGFAALRREVIAGILPNLNSLGPEITEELLYHFLRSKYRIMELPYDFHDRGGGKSKLDFFKLFRCLKATILLKAFGRL
ncbi:MAG: glycosyltransferase [Candidatus Wallbacteria bacterium]|nr:glycosyltransferase [Candidatus Wallbacteria bacterium]